MLVNRQSLKDWTNELISSEITIKCPLFIGNLRKEGFSKIIPLGFPTTVIYFLLKKTFFLSLAGGTNDLIGTQVNDNIWHWQLLAQDQPNRYLTHFHFPKLLIERMHHHLRAIVPKFFASSFLGTYFEIETVEL